MSNLKSDFDSQLNEFLGRFGLKRGEFILRTLLNKPKASIGENKKRKLITRYTIAEASENFGLASEEIMKGTGRRASEARWAVVNILKLYTNTTYAELQDFLGFNKRALAYANRKCNEMLEVPRFEKEFNRKYRAIEIKLVAFLTKI